MAKKEYRRLTGARMRRRGFFSATATRSSLWLGGDHMLQIDATGYTEEYKRFYFRDIQAFVLCGSRRRVILNLVVGIPMIICAMLWIANLMSPEPMSNVGVFLGGLATGLLAVPLFVNNVLGPTCNCYLRTAVQTERLVSLSRFRRANHVIRRLRPLIAGAQGQLTPDEAAARLREAAGTSEPAATASSPATPTPAAESPGAATENP